MALIDQPFVFVIGAPRSGTTWLQTLLGAHPEVVTGQESHVFYRYIHPLTEAWQRSLQSMIPERRYIGLASYLTQEEFDGLVRHFVSTVFSKLEGLKPGARVILEKTPDHAFHIDLISYYLPTARFVHVIRDGRDVAVSMIASSRSWGRHWAPGSVKAAAEEWKAYVLAGLEGRTLGDRYREVRYEHLLTDGICELQRLFSFLEVDCTRDLAARIYRAQRFESHKNGGEKSEVIVRSGEVLRQTGTRLAEPDGFYRKGIAGDWQTRLSTLDLQVFCHVAGDLLVELGYEDSETVQRNTFVVRPVYDLFRAVRCVLRLLRLEALLKRIVSGS